MEIRNTLKRRSDLYQAQLISDHIFGIEDYEDNKNIFAYFGRELLGLLSYGDYKPYIYDGQKFDLYIHYLYVDKMRRFNGSKSYNIGSRLLFELMKKENNKSYLLYAVDSEGFYRNIGMSYLGGDRFGSTNLSQIQQNLQKKLQSPGYVKLTENDLVRL